MKKRFETFKLPDIYSKNGKVINISLNRAGRSKTSHFYSNAARGLEYKPKYNIIWKKLSVSVPKFDKT